MKSALLLGIALSSFASLACEPHQLNQIYADQLDAIHFTMGGALKGEIRGEILSKATSIKLKNTTIRELNVSFISSEKTGDNLTAIHKIRIGSLVDTVKGQVYVAQNFEVKNTFDQACVRQPADKDQQISSSEIMSKFDADFVENHADYIKNSGDVDYSFGKFKDTKKIEETLIKVIEKKDLKVTKNNPKANYIINFELVTKTPLACTVKGILISQAVIAGEKNITELPEVRSLTCSLAVKRISRDALPKL